VLGHERFYAIAYNREKRLSGWANDMIGKAAPELLHPMPGDMLSEISDREEPCELVCILKKHEDDEERVRRAILGRENPLVVLCDRPNAPGNLGTVVRSADAFGAAAVLTCGHSADFYDPACIRSSIGTVFHVPFLSFGSTQEVLAFVDSLPVRLTRIGTSAKGVRHMHEADLTGPILLALGNETFGLSKAWKDSCDELFRIPIYGGASSLNLGSAASICLYEIARQRNFDGHI